MSKLKIYDSMQCKKVLFEPIDPKNIRVYACGPTVYDYAHIGNARMAVVFDTLVRLLREQYGKVTYVSNITDIDDKIIERSKKEKVSVQSITNKFFKIYNDDMKTQSGKVRVRPKDPKGLRTLLQSGIGFGYHVVHQKGKNIFHKQMDESTMKKAATVSNITIYYGGKTGRGKRIDMEMESPLYSFKLNIRDTQGNDGYPTRMMCDFKDKI